MRVTPQCLAQLPLHRHIVQDEYLFQYAEAFVEIGDLLGFQGAEAVLQLLHVPFRDALPRFQPGRDDFHKKMSANRQNKDIEEPKRCHALLLLYTSTTALPAHDCQGTGPVAHLGAPRPGVSRSEACRPLPSWGGNYTRFRACAVGDCDTSSVPCHTAGVWLVGGHHLISGSPHTTR